MYLDGLTCRFTVLYFLVKIDHIVSLALRFVLNLDVNLFGLLFISLFAFGVNGNVEALQFFFDLGLIGLLSFFLKGKRSKQGQFIFSMTSLDMITF